MTARDLITRALRAIGVIAQGESPTAAELTDGLQALRDLLDSWGTQRQTIYSIDRAIFDLVAGTADYTLGEWVSTGTSPQPTVTPQGAAGTTTYQYRIVVTLTTGEVWPGSPPASTSTGNATLGLVNYNRITWSAVSGAASYAVYRSSGGGSSGLLQAGLTTTTFDDTGIAGDGSELPDIVPADTHWEHVRPVWVEGHALLVNTNAAQPLELPLARLTLEQYQDVRLKGVTSPLPRQIFINEGWPYATVTLWPVPTDETHQVVLYLPVAVSTFADLSTDYTLPPGYVDALRYQLAVRLAPEYGRVLDPQIAQLAADAIANVKRANWEPIEMQVDEALSSSVPSRRTFNWLTGQ